MNHSPQHVLAEEIVRAAEGCALPDEDEVRAAYAVLRLAREGCEACRALVLAEAA